MRSQNCTGRLRGSHGERAKRPSCKSSRTLAAACQKAPMLSLKAGSTCSAGAGTVYFRKSMILGSVDSPSCPVLGLAEAHRDKIHEPVRHGAIAALVVGVAQRTAEPVQRPAGSAKVQRVSLGQHHALQCIAHSVTATLTYKHSKRTCASLNHRAKHWVSRQVLVHRIYGESSEQHGHASTCSDLA